MVTIWSPDISENLGKKREGVIIERERRRKS